MATRNVVPKAPVLTKQAAKALFASALLRVVTAHGKGTVADAMDCTPRTIDNALSMSSLPELDTAMNALRIDPSAFDELLSHYGFRIVPLDSDASEEAALLASTLKLCTAHAAALADPVSPGVIDHREEQQLAKLARPVATVWTGRVAAADRKRA